MSEIKLTIFECLVRKQQVQGLRSFKNQEFSIASDYFQNKSNAEIDVFLQAIIKNPTLYHLTI